jgi:hypothetical protein
MNEQESFKYSSLEYNILKRRAKDRGLPEDIYFNLISFGKYVVPKIQAAEWLDWAWFHYYLAKTYQKIALEDLSVLTVEMPPQCGKSLFNAVVISFIIGSMPNKRIIYSTYNETRAVEFTKEYLWRIMNSKEYQEVFPDIYLKSSLDKKDNSAEAQTNRKTTTQRDNEFNVVGATGEPYSGKFIALGIGQGSHGRPADFYFIDDYVSNSKNTLSEQFKLNLASWFANDTISRFQGGYKKFTKFIITSTRWFENDPVGILNRILDEIEPKLEENNVQIKRMSVKLRAEYRRDDNNIPEDPRTKENEPLWDAMAYKFALAKAADKDSFNIVYNQDPPNSFGMKQVCPEDFGYYDKLPKAGLIYICMDGASTVGARSDHTAIGVWKVLDRKRYLMRLYYVKLETMPLMEYMAQILINDFPDYYCVLIEHANSGVAVHSYLKENNYKNIIRIGFKGNDLDSLNKLDITQGSIKESNSKIDRYNRALPEFKHNEKRILLPSTPIMYQNEFIHQFTTFTGERNKKDDMVDMGVYLINYTSNTFSIISNTQYHKSSEDIYYNINNNQSYFCKKE